MLEGKIVLLTLIENPTCGKQLDISSKDPCYETWRWRYRAMGKLIRVDEMMDGAKSRTGFLKAVS